MVHFMESYTNLAQADFRGHNCPVRASHPQLASQRHLTTSRYGWCLKASDGLNLYYVELTDERFFMIPFVSVASTHRLATPARRFVFFGRGIVRDTITSTFAM
jgi:hypothetical protein